MPAVIYMSLQPYGRKGPNKADSAGRKSILASQEESLGRSVPHKPIVAESAKEKRPVEQKFILLPKLEKLVAPKPAVNEANNGNLWSNLKKLVADSNAYQNSETISENLPEQQNKTSPPIINEIKSAFQKLSEAIVPSQETRVETPSNSIWSSINDLLANGKEHKDKSLFSLIKGEVVKDEPLESDEKNSGFLNSVLAGDTKSEASPKSGFAATIRSMLADPSAIDQISKQTSKTQGQVTEQLFTITKSLLASSNDNQYPTETLTFLASLKSILADSNVYAQKAESDVVKQKEPIEVKPEEKVETVTPELSGLFDTVKNMLAQSEQKSEDETVKKEKPDSEPAKIEKLKNTEDELQSKSQAVDEIIDKLRALLIEFETRKTLPIPASLSHQDTDFPKKTPALLKSEEDQASKASVKKDHLDFSGLFDSMKSVLAQSEEQNQKANNEQFKPATDSYESRNYKTNSGVLDSLHSTVKDFLASSYKEYYSFHAESFFSKLKSFLASADSDSKESDSNVRDWSHTSEKQQESGFFAKKGQSESFPTLDFVSSLKSILADPESTSQRSEEAGESTTQVFDSLYGMAQRFLASSTEEASSLSNQAKNFLGSLKSVLADASSEAELQSTQKTSERLVSEKTVSDFWKNVLASSPQSRSFPTLDLLATLNSVLADSEAAQKRSEETGESQSQFFESLSSAAKRFLASSADGSRSAQTFTFLNNLKSILAESDSDSTFQQSYQSQSENVKPKTNEVPVQKIEVKRNVATDLDFSTLFDSLKSVLAQSEYELKEKEDVKKEQEFKSSKVAAPETPEPSKMQDCKVGEHSAQCRQKLISLLKTFVEENW